MEFTPALCFLRTMFCVLGCLMVATLVYTICADGSPFRTELLTPWMSTTLVDFYVNVVALAVWVISKESKWSVSLLWITLLVCFGSVATCAYIVLQCFKLSSQDSKNDFIYQILLPHRNIDTVGQKRKLSSVSAGGVLFSVLGFVMLGLLVYTICTDGSPFRKELLTPWMTALLIDFYINIGALSLWVACKESSWTTALIWIVLLICFGSVTTCVYIAQHLFSLSPQHPLHLVLLNSGSSNLRAHVRFKRKLEREFKIQLRTNSRKRLISLHEGIGDPWFRWKPLYNIIDCWDRLMVHCFGFLS